MAAVNVVRANVFKASLLWPLLASVAYILLRIAIEFPQPPQIRPDSQDYLFNATLPLGLAFFSCAKPAGAALLYKLAAGNLSTIVFLQSTFSIFSWLFLGLAAFRAFSDRLVQWAAFLAVLVFSMNPDLAGWNAIIMSESLSLSLMALLAGLLLVLARTWSWTAAAGLVLTGLWWALTKETNAWLVGLGGVLLASIGILVHRTGRWLAVGLMFVSIFLLAYASSNLGERWRFPLLNVIGQRILTDPTAADFFHQRGMPDAPEISALAGAWGDTGGHAFDNDPALRAFQDWFLQRGNQTYRLYLLSNPVRTLTAPLDHLPVIFAPHIPRSPSFEPPAALGLLFLVMTTLVLALAAALNRNIQRPAVFVVATSLFLLTYVQLLLIWQGDAMEVNRHAAGVRAELGLSIILLLAASVDCPLLGGGCEISGIRLDHPRQIASRALLAGGILIIVVSVLFDLITNRGYFTFQLAFGLQQLAGVTAGAVLVAAGLFTKGLKKKRV